MAMYMIFIMIGTLLLGAVTRNILGIPLSWTVEMAQFTITAYYILGGPYSLQMGSNVRMDLFYGTWSFRKKAWFDLLTVLFLIFYLGVLLYGAISSTAYSLGYWGTEPFSFFAGLLTGAEEIGRMERSSTAWRPYMWPIKALMIVGMFLMLLQCLSELFKDILRVKGEAI